MVVSKQIADFLTLSRSILSFLFVWLAKDNSPDTLPAAIFLLLFCWVTDILDGPLARHSRIKYQNIIGENDILADIMVTTGAAIYLIMVGYLNRYIGISYMLFFFFLFLRFGYKGSLGTLYMPAVYLYFIWIAYTHAPAQAIWLFIYILLATIFSWRRLITDRIPHFFNGFKDLN